MYLLANSIRGTWSSRVFIKNHLTTDMKSMDYFYVALVLFSSFNDTDRINETIGLVLYTIHRSIC